MTIGLLIALFLFVLAAVSGAGYAFVLRPALKEDLIPTGLGGGGAGAHSALTSVFRMLGEAVPEGRGADDLRSQLAAAGFRSPSAIDVFQGIKVATSLLLALMAAWAADGQMVSGLALVIGAIAGAGFGFLLPDRVLDKLVASRMARLRRALPAALELMVLAIEAGQGLDAAIAETSRGLRVTHTDLASEFTQLQLELRAATTRADALRKFADRGRDIELRKFASLLIDTDRFGTSLGPALKTHARYLRIRFRQSAQEQARKVAVKLIFPVFFLIFPSVILVTLGPAVMLLMRQLDNLFNSF